jgi:lipopolysaccharide transport system permease protein
MTSRPADVSRPIVITAGRGWRRLDLRELWDYRELLLFFVWRDLKVRYKQTAFGALWAVIQPFLLMVVFSLFLGRIGGIAPAGIPYPLFAFSGLVPWTLFAQSLSGSSNSLVEAANLLQKVYFPRLLLPAASTGSYLVDFAIAMVVLAGLMVFFGVLPAITVLWLVPITVLVLASALAVGIWLSAVNVRYRDVRYAIPFLVQLWLFATPVAYPIDLVPAAVRPIYSLNPMVGAIDAFRWSLFGVGEAPLQELAIAVAVTALVLVSGIAYFRRVERTFADVI